MAVAISEIVTKGVIFDMKNWNNQDLNTDNLPEVIERLFTTLLQRKINYLLVGGVALLSYVEGRNTQDIDFILARKDLQSLSEFRITEENKDLIRENFDELKIDILLTQNQLLKNVLQQFVTERRFGERLIRCVTVEGLILLKLYALPSLYRQGKFDRVSIYENDILLLMLNYSVDLHSILNLLAHHVIATDLDEVKSMVADIESRIKRFSLQRKRLNEEQP